MDWHRSAGLRLSITLQLSVILLSAESLCVPSASPPPRHWKHNVGFTFTFSLTRRRQRRPRGYGSARKNGLSTHSSPASQLNMQPCLIKEKKQKKNKQKPSCMFSPKSERLKLTVWRLQLDARAMLVLGQVDKCPSTEWSVRPDQS